MHGCMVQAWPACGGYPGPVMKAEREASADLRGTLSAQGPHHQHLRPNQHALQGQGASLQPGHGQHAAVFQFESKTR